MHTKRSVVLRPPYSEGPASGKTLDVAARFAAQVEACFSRDLLPLQRESLADCFPRHWPAAHPAASAGPEAAATAMIAVARVLVTIVESLDMIEFPLG